MNWFWRFAIIIGGGIIVDALLGNDEDEEENQIEPSKINLHNNFCQFNQRIEPLYEKVKNLRSGHNAIRDVVVRYLSDKGESEPDFFIQGSYKTKTLIENRDPNCDVDLGVYFQGKPRASIKTLRYYISDALKFHTSRGTSIKRQCVRLHYVREFHIDLPIYYTQNGRTYYANGDNEWIRSEPKKFVYWFQEKVRKNPQVVRIIRYFKAWSDKVKSTTNRKMPGGIVLTIWVFQFYESHYRDDVAFTKTVKSLFNYLNTTDVNYWEAKMVVEPFDNTLDRLNNGQRSFFLSELETMMGNATKAIKAHNYLEAETKWRKVFGRLF